MVNSNGQLGFHFLFILSAFQPKSSAQKEKSIIVDPHELWDGIVTPGPDAYADWTDWDEWTPSPDVLKAFPIYRMGYDNDGLVGECWPGQSVQS